MYLHSTCCEKMFEPSKYQNDIYEFVTNGIGNGIIEAVAGSGKTTTIVNATKYIKKGEKVVFLAFNTSIRDELKKRLPKTITVSTLHSLGKSMFFKNKISPTLEQSKLRMLVKGKLRNYDEPEKSVLTSFLLDVIPKVKMSMCKVEKDDIQYLPNVYANVTPTRVKLIKDILDDCLSIPQSIDFDDMIWIPIIKKFDSFKYDWVFVDEVQDLSRAQFELIKMICDDHTRVISVGDSKQAIYGFRCADSESMKNFKEYFHATELPLSICYRCPKKVVQLAKEFVPQIESYENAPDGIVKIISLNDMVSIAQPNDLILCRTNAPLVNVMFTLLRAGKKATISGRDTMKYIQNSIEQYAPTNLEDLQTKVTNRKIRVSELLHSLILQPTSEEVIKEKRRCLSIIDLSETILFFIDNSSSISDLNNKLNELFSDKVVDITCSTVHRVKGLEADRVFIYRHDLMPHPRAVHPRELQEERNIEYVAITRAKKELYFIENATRY